MGQLTLRKNYVILCLSLSAGFRCGGHKYGTSGDFMAGADGTAGCDWLLRTPAGKGIILDLTGLQAAVRNFP